MVRKKTRLAIIRLAHSFGAKVRFINSTDAGGYYHTNPKRTIHISKSLGETCRQLLSTCCHEIGHLIAYQLRKFPQYHHLKKIERLNRQERLAVKRTAMRAERYVDAIGCKIFKKHFPHLRYERSYAKASDRRWLRNYLAKLY